MFASRFYTGGHVGCYADGLSELSQIYGWCAEKVNTYHFTKLTIHIDTISVILIQQMFHTISVDIFNIYHCTELLMPSYNAFISYHYQTTKYNVHAVYMLLTYSLTYSIVQDIWKVDSYSACQRIACFL